MSSRDLEADHLAEAAAAHLLLDGLEQVVGLVGDVVVGVAGDPEERVVDDLHPREEVARLAAITSSSGTKVVPSPIARKRRSSSFGTLTRATTSSSFSGLRSSTAMLSERFEM